MSSLLAQPRIEVTSYSGPEVASQTVGFRILDRREFWNLGRIHHITSPIYFESEPRWPKNARTALRFKAKDESEKTEILGLRDDELIIGVNGTPVKRLRCPNNADNVELCLLWAVECGQDVNLLLERDGTTHQHVLKFYRNEAPYILSEEAVNRWFEQHVQLNRHECAIFPGQFW